jgi:hydroxyacylglutathione hydrolase
MQILKKTGGVAMTNCFLIADEKAKQAVLFDAPDHTTGPLLDEAVKRGWDVIGLWLTHGHFDHFADHAVVRQRFPGVKILVHALDEAKARNPDLQTRMFGLPFTIPPVAPDVQVTDNQQLKIGALEVTAIHTPGHSPGSVVYYFPKEGILVGGDLIIGGSVGRTDLPDSDHSKLEASLRRVMALPAATRLLGGHGPETTLAEERRDNPFVQEALGSSGTWLA